MSSNRSPFAASVAIHIVVATAMLTIVSVPSLEPLTRRPAIRYIDLAPHRLVLRLTPREFGGGGGGLDALPVIRGQLPKASPHPFVPPMIYTASTAALLLEPALLTTAENPTLVLPQWGDPIASGLIPSNGPGRGGGMGNGEGRGVGSKTGPLVGSGDDVTGGRTGFRGGFTAPQIVHQVEPEFSEEARRAKLHGTVILIVEVDTTGRPTHIRVVRPLGLGLDEKAVEAVSRWIFRPGLRDGRPVTVPATIEVNFHLL